MHTMHTDQLRSSPWSIHGPRTECAQLTASESLHWTSDEAAPKHRRGRWPAALLLKTR